MKINLRHLQIFLEVAQRGSMIRAAAALHLTPPAVSMQIKEIEKHLGITLLDRTKGRVSLSAAGEYFAGYARRVLADMKEAEIAIARLKGLERGLLTIGIVSMAEYFVPKMLARFHDTHPGIDVRIRVAHNREQLIALMDAAEVDLSVMGRPPKELVGTRAEAFATNPLVFVCSPGHPLLSRKSLSLKALDEQPFIVGEQGSGARAAMEAFLIKHSCTPHITMEISSNETIKHAVMAGMGLGFLSLHTIGLELSNGLIKVLDIQDTPLMATWNIVHLHSRILSPAAEAFRLFVTKQGKKDLRVHNSMLLSLALKRKRLRLADEQREA